MIIDEYINKTNDVIKEGNQRKALEFLEEVINVYKSDIPNIEEGTTYLTSKCNMVWNLNNLDEPLSEECDAISDLKLVLIKLKKYRELQMFKSEEENKTTINISGSTIKDSNIGNSNSLSNNNQEKHWFTNKLIIPIIVGIISSVIAGIILLLININK